MVGESLVKFLFNKHMKYVVAIFVVAVLSLLLWFILIGDSGLYVLNTPLDKDSIDFEIQDSSGLVDQAKAEVVLADEKIAQIEQLVEEEAVVSFRLRIVAHAEADLDSRLDGLLSDYTGHMDYAVSLMEDASAQGLDVEELAQLIAEKTVVHSEVLLDVYEKVPERARERIMNVVSNNNKGHEKATEAVQNRNQVQERYEKRVKNIEGGLNNISRGRRDE